MVVKFCTQRSKRLLIIGSRATESTCPSRHLRKAIVPSMQHPSHPTFALCANQFKSNGIAVVTISPGYTFVGVNLTADMVWHKVYKHPTLCFLIHPSLDEQCWPRNSTGHREFKFEDCPRCRRPREPTYQEPANSLKRRQGRNRTYYDSDGRPR